MMTIRQKVKAAQWTAFTFYRTETNLFSLVLFEAEE